MRHAPPPQSHAAAAVTKTKPLLLLLRRLIMKVVYTHGKLVRVHVRKVLAAATAAVQYGKRKNGESRYIIRERGWGDAGIVVLFFCCS